MADQTASFAVDLEDGTSGAANTAASALENLRKQLEADTAALRGMQAAMKNLQGGSSVNIEQFRKLKAQIEGKKSAIAEAQSSYLGLGGSFTKSAAGAKRSSSAFAQLLQTAKGVPGPLDSLIAKFGNLSSLMAGGAIALGIAAIAAAMIAMVAATGAAVIALGRYGLAQADARRNELLRLQGLTKLRNYWGLPAGNAEELQTAIDRVSSSVALGRDKVAQYSNQLYKMGLRGANLEAALEGVAIKATAQGDAYASAFAGMAAGAARTGHSVRALADNVKARLGGIAAAQLLSLDVQSQKLHESFAALFSGLKIEGLLKGISTITGLFSQNAAIGRALKAILETVFQPLADGAGETAPIIKRFFQGMTIAALQVGIVLLQVRNWFRRTFADSAVLKGIDLQTAAVTAGKVALGLFVAALTATGIVAGALALPFVAVGALLVEMYQRASAFVIAVSAVASLVTRAASAFGELFTTGLQIIRGVDWGKLGMSIVDGIVAGLRAGAPSLVAALKGLAGGAWSTFKQALGIASPSKAFMRLGLAIPQGVEGGVEAGTPSARRAVAGIVEVPSGPSFPRGAATEASSSSSSPASALGATTNSVSIGEIHIHTSSERPRDMATEFRDELLRVLEGVAIQIGAPVAGAT